MLPAEQALAEAKSKIFSAIKIEMIRQGYTVSSLAELLNVNRPTLSYAIQVISRMELSFICPTSKILVIML